MAVRSGIMNYKIRIQFEPMLNQDFGRKLLTSKSKNLFWLLQILRNAYPLHNTHTTSVKFHFAPYFTFKGWLFKNIAECLSFTHTTSAKFHFAPYFTFKYTALVQIAGLRSQHITISYFSHWTKNFHKLEGPMFASGVELTEMWSQL